WKPPRRPIPCGAPSFGSSAFSVEIALAVPLDAIPDLFAELQAGVPLPQVVPPFFWFAPCSRQPLPALSFALGKKAVKPVFVAAQRLGALAQAFLNRRLVLPAEIVVDGVGVVRAAAEERSVVARLHPEPELAADVARIIPTHVVRAVIGLLIRP